MKITPLPKPATLVEIIPEYQLGRAALYCEMTEKIIQDRDLAYTSLIQGLEAKMYLKPAGQRAKSRNNALLDIKENLIKPLYGKK